MLQDTIRTLVASLGDFADRPAGLSDDTNLYQAGLTSFGAAELMVELEAAFHIEFPRHLLTRATFETITAIAAAVAELQRTQADAANRPATHEVVFTAGAGR